MSDNATDFLKESAKILEERGKEYDQPDGERSMTRIVAAFNAATGYTLTERDGWLFLVMLKLVRLKTAPGFHRDSHVDAIGICALMAESAAKEWGK